MFRKNIILEWLYPSELLNSNSGHFQANQFTSADYFKYDLIGYALKVLGFLVFFLKS